LRASVCYSPNHSLALAELEIGEIIKLLRVWREQYVELGSHPQINHVLISRIRAKPLASPTRIRIVRFTPPTLFFKTIETEARVSERHIAETGRVLFQDILAAERADGRRIIFENESAVAFLP
jgi:UDPglucose--hexose-1-phosphate uridylyltransferase